MTDSFEDDSTKDQGSRPFRSISDFFSPSSTGSKRAIVVASDGEDDFEEEEDGPIMMANSSSRKAVLETTDSSFVVDDDSDVEEEEQEDDEGTLDEGTFDEQEDSCSSDVEILISLPSSDSEDNDYTSNDYADYATQTESELEMTLPTKKSKVSPVIFPLSQPLLDTDSEPIYIEQPTEGAIHYELTKRDLIADGGEVVSEAESLPIAASETERESAEESEDIRLSEDEEIPIAQPEVEPVKPAAELKPSPTTSNTPSQFVFERPGNIATSTKLAQALARLSPVRVIYPDPTVEGGKVKKAKGAAKKENVTKGGSSAAAGSAKPLSAKSSKPVAANNPISAQSTKPVASTNPVPAQSAKPVIVSAQPVNAIKTQNEVRQLNLTVKHPIPPLSTTQSSATSNQPALAGPTVNTVNQPPNGPTAVANPAPTSVTTSAIPTVSTTAQQQPSNSLASKELHQFLQTASTSTNAKPTVNDQAQAQVKNLLAQASAQTVPAKPTVQAQNVQTQTAKPTVQAQTVQTQTAKPTVQAQTVQPQSSLPLAAQASLAHVQQLTQTQAPLPPMQTANVHSAPIQAILSQPVFTAATSTSALQASVSDASISNQNSAKLTIRPPSSPAVIDITAPAPFVPSKTAFVYDQRMLLHNNLFESDHPERPDRISRIYDHLNDAGLLKKAQMLPVVLDPARLEEDLMRVHDLSYHQRIQDSAKIKDPERFAALGNDFNSVYLNEHSSLAASVAAAATIQLCRAIAQGDFENGFAIVRPPGHHAEHDEAMGFCLYNNVAVAAKNLYETGLAKKILILDWDVHHGNGTQNAFVENPDVLYMSLHRYDNGAFYPHMDEANHSFVGVKPALGRSVNVAWNGTGMGDGDYLYAFSRLIMPIAREFNPDFIIISAGFDAAQGDPIGQCMVTPFGYASMLHELSSLAGGRVAVVLEGGYDLEVITRCYEACVRTLLHEPLPKPPPGAIVSSLRGASAVESAVLSQSPHWRCLFPKLAEVPNAQAEIGINKDLVTTPMKKILQTFWLDECKKRFNLHPVPLLFSTIRDPEFTAKYLNQLLVQEKCLFGPEVLIVFAHESGPLLHTGLVPSMCLQTARLAQYTPFLDLMQACSTLPASLGFVNICVPSRPWKLKQAGFGDERECEELKLLFLLLWDQVIARSGCRKVFFVAAGAPAFGITNLLHRRDVTSVVQGVYLFSSTLFLPLVDVPGPSAWYKRNSVVVVPSSQERGAVIAGVQDKFGKCISGGQVLMADSGAMVSSFEKEILQFIRERAQIK